MTKLEVINEIKRIAKDCAEEGWDGYGAQPLPEAYVNQAIAFVEMLSDEILMPEEITPWPDGEISLEWPKSGDGWNFRFSLFFGPDDKAVICAGDIPAMEILKASFAKEAK